MDLAIQDCWNLGMNEKEGSIRKLVLLYKSSYVVLSLGYNFVLINI